MLQGNKDSKKMRLYNITPEVRIVFCRLKAAFTAILVLQYFDLAKSICLEMDASGFAITGILS